MISRDRFLLLAAVLAASAAPLVAGSPEFGNVCVDDYQPSSNCTANDVRIEEFIPIQVIENCPDGVPGEAEIVFQVLVSADGSPDRFDIGLFIALDGGDAQTGDDCMHDFLDPPLTTTPVYGDANGDAVPDILDGPWWDGEAPDKDTCGDIESDTQVIKTLVAVRIACVDTSVPPDGIVDLEACASWDNNTITDCNGVQEAFPGTVAKCSCDRIETGTEIPVELIGLTVQ